MLRAILLAGSLVFGTPGLAEVEGPIKHATAEWVGFTNRDGSGLYHELFREIFETQGLEVEVSYMPLNRAVSMVAAGEMDFTGGFTKDDRVFATHPVYETTYSMLVAADRPIDWTDPEQLKGLRIVGPPTIQAEVDFAMTELESRSQAGRMLLSGRADAYIDLHELIETFLETGTVVDVDQVAGDQGEMEINADDWKIVEVKTSRLFILFSDSERGRLVRDAYDAGTEALFQSGRLDEIYGKYNIRTPVIEPRG